MLIESLYRENQHETRTPRPATRNPHHERALSMSSRTIAIIKAMFYDDSLSGMLEYHQGAVERLYDPSDAAGISDYKRTRLLYDLAQAFVTPQMRNRRASALNQRLETRSPSSVARGLRLEGEDDWRVSPSFPLYHFSSLGRCMKFPTTTMPTTASRLRDEVRVMLDEDFKLFNGESYAHFISSGGRDDDLFEDVLDWICPPDVSRTSRPRILTPQVISGNLSYRLIRSNGDVGQHSAARIILSLFRSPPRSGQVADVLDGDRGNICVDNLFWRNSGPRPLDLPPLLPPPKMDDVRKVFKLKRYKTHNYYAKRGMLRAYNLLED